MNKFILGKQSGRGNLLFPLWAVFGAGIVTLLIMLIIFVGQERLGGQLGAKPPVKGACYRDSGCSVTTSSYCKANSGVNFKFHWISGKGCLEEYIFAPKASNNKKCNFPNDHISQGLSCIYEIEEKIKDICSEADKIVSYPGSATIVHHERRGLNFGSYPFYCDITCSAVAQCIPDPSPSLTPTSKPTESPKSTSTPKPTETPKSTSTPKPTETFKPTETSRNYPDGDGVGDEKYGELDVDGTSLISKEDAEKHAWGQALDLNITDSECQSKHEDEAMKDLETDSVECKAVDINTFSKFMDACGPGLSIDDSVSERVKFACSLCSCES